MRLLLPGIFIMILTLLYCKYRCHARVALLVLLSLIQCLQANLIYLLGNRTLVMGFDIFWLHLLFLHI